MRFNAPVFVTEDIMDEAGIKEEQKEEGEDEEAESEQTEPEEVSAEGGHLPESSKSCRAGSKMRYVTSSTKRRPGSATRYRV